MIRHVESNDEGKDYPKVMKTNVLSITLGKTKNELNVNGDIKRKVE